jgi:hypothetical protein
MWHFGKPFSLLNDWLARKQGAPKPTQVWITSLCSYWFGSTAEMCRVVKQAMPGAEIILLGQYPRLMPQHAAETCAADLIISGPFNLDSTVVTLDLYGQQKPTFLALRLDPKTAISEINLAVKKDVTHFAFFEDDLLSENGDPFIEIFQSTKDLHPHLRFHAICGLYPARVTTGIARLLAKKTFAEFHFEEAEGNGRLFSEAYQQACRYLTEAGLERRSDKMSGFAWIGRPREKLEDIILRSFRVLQQCGSLILKPFSPTPGGTEAGTHSNYLSKLPPRNWSPHLFPFSELNRITRDEYYDLYRIAAFLNEKVRNRSFAFLDGSLGAEFLRNSLRKEVWKLGEATFRSSD